MSNRITQKDLETLVREINKVTGSPVLYSTKGDDGVYKSNIGHYHLDYAYGGVNLARITSEGGGITKPLGGGYHTKRELYSRLNAFLSGLYAQKKDDTESKEN